MPPPGDKRTLSASGKSAAALPEVADLSPKSSSEVFLTGQMEWEEGKEEKSPVLFLGPKDSGPQDSFLVLGCPFYLF